MTEEKIEKSENQATPEVGTEPAAEVATKVAEKPGRGTDAKAGAKGQSNSMAQKPRKRASEYGQQLAEKQLAKKIYGIRERQFRNYFKEALRQQGDTGDILRQLLQMRLDNVIYQTGIAKTQRAARQMVSHGYFLVNGKKVNIPSYQVKIKDLITIKPSKQGKKIWDEEFKQRLEEKPIPSWIAFDKATITAKITAVPTGNELDQLFNARLIVEFYSR